MRQTPPPTCGLRRVPVFFRVVSAIRAPHQTPIRIKALDVSPFEAPLRAGVSSNNGPARSRRKPPAAGARARGVPLPLSLQPQHSESATQRHGACGVAMHAACAWHRMRPGSGVPSGGWGWLKATPPAAKRKPPAGCMGAAATLRHAGEVSRVNHGMSLGAILHSREGNALRYPQPPCTDRSSSPSPDDSLITKARTAPCDVGRAGLKVFPGDRYQIRAHPEHVIRLTPLFSIPALFEKARNLIPNAA